jgi:general secretion pathway protein E
MIAMEPLPAAILAETAVPFFLMSAAKPAVTLAAVLAYFNVVTVKLLPDAQMYQTFKVSPQKWSAIFLAFGAAAIAAVLLVPTWFGGFPLMLALMAAPCALYVKERGKKLAGTRAKPILFLAIDFSKRAAERRARNARASVALRFERKDRSEHPVPDKADPGFPAYDALQQVLGGAMRDRASRVDLVLTKQGAQVQLVVDAMRVRRDPVPPESAAKVVDLLKSFAGLDTAERRKFQKGKVGVLDDNGRTVVTVTSVGSMQGETVRAEFEREKQLTIPFESSGFLEPQRKLLDEALAARARGVVLFGARPGNGVTTLAYMLLARHDALTSNIQTLERRPERNVDGVEHGEFDAGKSDYATQLQSIVRRGPDVVLVTEPGEPGVGKVVCSPGAAGSLFYVALPNDMPADMMAMWAKVAGSAEAAGANLNAVVSQRLVRKLCQSCRAPYSPNPAEQKMLGIPAGKQLQLYKQSGKVLVKDQPVECPTCKGSGFMGILAATEVLVLDDEARRLLSSGDIKGAYLQARRAHKSPSLQDTALMRVRAGETSFDEVKRAFAPPAATPAPGQKPAAGAAAPAKPGAAPAKPGAAAAKPGTQPTQRKS